MSLITDDLMPALQGIVPSVVTTCSLEGEPNTTVISQVWYVDAEHVALSYQFFNKTRRNISENAQAAAMIFNPENWTAYNLDLTYVRTEKEGDLFDEMEMKLEAIASMVGMAGVFELQGADIYRVESVKQMN
jgi:hypothetical protein